MTNSRSLPLSVPLPEGFVGERDERGWVAARSAEREALVAAGFFDSQKIAGMGEATTLGGRASLRRVRLPSGPALLRPYLHGGLLRFLTGARFLDCERPFRELDLAARFRESGLPTPEPLAAAAFGGVLGYRLYFLSREIPGVDLFEFLRRPTDAARRKGVLRAAGEALRRLHESGWVHADLHPKNLLVEEKTEKIHFLDLDRSYRISPLPAEERRRNLSRLFRFGERRKVLSGEGAWSEEDFLALLRGYEPENAAVGELVKEFGRVSPIHRLGWSLEKIFAGKS